MLSYLIHACLYLELSLLLLLIIMYASYTHWVFMILTPPITVILLQVRRSSRAEVSYMYMLQRDGDLGLRLMNLCKSFKNINYIG